MTIKITRKEKRGRLIIQSITALPSKQEKSRLVTKDKHRGEKKKPHKDWFCAIDKFQLEARERFLAHSAVAEQPTGQ